MHEVDHTKRQFSGAAGEAVTVNVNAKDTTSLVMFTLDGVSSALPPGAAIQFNLKNASGAMTPLQINMDFNALGSYEIVVSNVVDCIKAPGTGTCKHTRQGPPLVTENYRFVVA